MTKTNTQQSCVLFYIRRSHAGRTLRKGHNDDDGGIGATIICTQKKNNKYNSDEILVCNKFWVSRVPYSDSGPIYISVQSPQIILLRRTGLRVEMRCWFAGYVGYRNKIEIVAAQQLSVYVACTCILRLSAALLYSMRTQANKLNLKITNHYGFCECCTHSIYCSRAYSIQCNPLNNTVELKVVAYVGISIHLMLNKLLWLLHR